MEIIASNRRGLKICYHGYMYTKQIARKTKVWWKCAERTVAHCQGSLMTNLECENPEIGLPHNHPPNEAKIHLAKVRNLMKDRAVTTLDEQAEIYTHGVSSCEPIVQQSIDCKALEFASDIKEEVTSEEEDNELKVTFLDEVNKQEQGDKTFYGDINCEKNDNMKELDQSDVHGEEVALEIIASNKRGQKLCYHGYMYTKQVTRKTKLWWKCAEKSLTNCKGSLMTNLECENPETGQPHNHPPNQAKIHLAKVRNLMKDRAVTTLDEQAEIYAHSGSPCGPIVTQTREPKVPELDVNVKQEVNCEVEDDNELKVPFVYDVNKHEQGDETFDGDINHEIKNIRVEKNDNMKKIRPA